MKGKILFCFFYLFFFIFWGCSSLNNIKRVQDPYKEQTVISLSQKIKSVEGGFFDSRESALLDIDYTKEIDQNGKAVYWLFIRMKFNSRRSKINPSSKIEPIAVMLIDGEKFKIELSDVKNTQNILYHERPSRVITYLGRYGPETTLILGQTTAYTFYALYAKMNPQTEKFQNAINAKYASLRFYINRRPFTFRIEGKDLKKLKKFLATQ